MNTSAKLPFVTYDKALASALITKGFKLQSRRYSPSGKVYFTFHGAESLKHMIELYWNDELFLNARTLLSEYRKHIRKPNNRLT